MPGGDAFSSSVLQAELVHYIELTIVALIYQPMIRHGDSRRSDAPMYDRLISGLTQHDAKVLKSRCSDSCSVDGADFIDDYVDTIIIITASNDVVIVAVGAVS